MLLAASSMIKNQQSGNQPNRKKKLSVSEATAQSAKLTPIVHEEAMETELNLWVCWD